MHKNGGNSLAAKPQSGTKSASNTPGMGIKIPSIRTSQHQM